MSEQNQKTTLTVRIDNDLAKQFKKIAKANNRMQAQLLRDWITQYVKKNGQGDLFK